MNLSSGLSLRSIASLREVLKSFKMFQQFKSLKSSFSDVRFFSQPAMRPFGNPL
jgi:hypothetical protein